MRMRFVSSVVRVLGTCLLAVVFSLVAVHAQRGGAAQTSDTSDKPKPSLDPLGRDTPRGTVRGFLNAARQGESELARQYLNTPQSDATAAAELAHELFVVLDARLPARLTQLSDVAEGSRSNPLTPNQELVGTIAEVGGSVDIHLERVEQASGGLVWLFSSRTLESIPQLYTETIESRFSAILPGFLTNNRVAGIRLAEWLAIVLGLPVFYFATVLLNRILTPLIGGTWHRLFKASLFNRNVLPRPARLLLLALVSRWLLASLPLSLLVRQFWSNVATLVTIGAAVWLLILLNGEAERYIHRRLPGANVTAAVSLLRLGRRVVDVLILFAGLLATLRHFGVDPTPVLAGLGVGGIAVALAAQKTLENVIAGASLIFDQAVRVGDSLKMGDVSGTVAHIGLRSTRIRTLDRTVVSVPNSQIANMSLETLSDRDKCWFHPVVGLRYETTSEQLREVIGNIHRLLAEHRSVDRESVRVRFLRLGAFSLDVDVSAYVVALDWNHFMEIQEQLLFSVTEIVEKAGTKIAFPSQTMYVANAPPPVPSADSLPARR